MAGNKKPSRTEKRIKNAKGGKVPEAIRALPDEAMQKAAMILARTGYKKSAGRRNGAVTYASRIANVDRTTIYNWLGDELFLTAIEEAKARLLDIAWAGIEKGADKGDHKCCVEMLAQVDSDFDRAWLREKDRQAHEERMLRLKIELAQLTPEGDDSLPQIVFRETAQGGRIETPKDEDLQ